MSSPGRLKAAIDCCRRIQKHHGTSYYFATRFFPPDLREATYVVYAFLRLPDEIVDSAASRDPLLAASRLQEWRNKWERAYASGTSTEPVLEAAASVFNRYGIDVSLAEAFFDAMGMDIEKKRYQTFQELTVYTHGSAEVVGEMMCRVIGYTDSAALEYSRMLGRAMQLTNFLRDIREDYQERGRIYFPQEELRQFHLSDDDIAQQRMSESFRAFMRFQVTRCRDLYTYAEQGIAFLPESARFAVTMACRLYAAILGKIEGQGYDVFRKRARTSLLEKLAVVSRVRRERR